MDLGALDRLCYTSMSPEISNQHERENATRQLEQIANNAESSKGLLQAISQTDAEYTMYFASSALEKIITEFFNSFTEQDRRSIRALLSRLFLAPTPFAILTKPLLICSTGSMVSSILFQRAELLTRFSALPRQRLAQFAARLWRLSWFDMTGSDTDADAIGVTDMDGMDGDKPSANISLENDPLLSEIGIKMLTDNRSLVYPSVGCTILAALVRDMSQHLSHYSSNKYRRVSIAFRDKVLIDIFKEALGVLTKLQRMGLPMTEPVRSQHRVLVHEVLQLVQNVLNFDFIGTQPDDADEGSVIHVPNTWSSLMESTSTLNLFFELYAQFNEYHKEILDVLILLAAVRNSVYKSNESRSAFLSVLFNGVGKIISERIGMDRPELRHLVVRMLARLKTNFNMSHFLKLDVYPQFIQAVAKFCCDICHAGDGDPTLNTIHYVVMFWSKMVHAINFMPDDTPNTLLDTFAPQVFIAFASCQIEHETNQPEWLEDILEDRQLPIILDQVPKMVTVGDYSNITGQLMNGLVGITKNFSGFAQMPPVSSDYNAAASLERQLAWMVQIITWVVGSRSNSEEDETCDAQLIAAVFDVLRLHDTRIGASGVTAATKHLEMALILFLKKFSRMYFHDGNVDSKMHAAIAERHGLTDPGEVIEAILSKIAMSVKSWAHTEIASEALEVFFNLSSSRNSSQLLQQSPLVQHMLKNHTELELGNTMRVRFDFYKTLSKLMYRDIDFDQFESFVLPFDQKLVAIQDALANNMVNKEVAVVTRQLMNDLRGVLASCFAQKSYEFFFDWFYPSGYFQSVLVRAVEQFAFNDWKTVWAVMKFIDEFCSNKHRRISFTPTSADGVRLFRDGAHVLLRLGEILMRLSSGGLVGSDTTGDAQHIRFTGLVHYFKVFTSLITGDYANLGVLLLYEDPGLTQLVSMTYNIIFAIDISEMSQFVKASEGVYSAMETLCVHDVALFFQMVDNLPMMNQQSREPLLARILINFRQGLRSPNLKIRACACAAIDKIVTYQITQLLKRRRQAQTPLLEDAYQRLLGEILFDVLDLLLNEHDNAHWTLTKPLFSLIMLLPDVFQNVKNMMVQSQAMDGGGSQERAQRLEQQFEKLMDKVERSIKPDNRERFTQNAAAFRTEVQQFIDLNLLYKVMTRVMPE